jgi:spore maturation protein CgeB
MIEMAREKLPAVRSVLIGRGAFDEIYEPAWQRALTEMGIPCQLFDSHSLTLPGVLGRIERHFFRGPGIARIKREFISLVQRERPEITLLYQGHYFDRRTLEQIRPFTFITGYHNDDPFGARKSFARYRMLLPALPLYHGYHVYRACNVADALRYGVPRAKVLMSYYIPWLDYPRHLSSEDMQAFGSELIFAGHAENDVRLECLAAAVRQGVKVRIYGLDNYWRRALPAEVYDIIKPISKVAGDDYRKSLCAAKIAACFFSRWNRDQYTRRSFEIPACGVFLLAERTPVMQELYKEGEEAEFFDSPAEFLDKVKFYLKNDSLRQRIAAAGFRRVTSSGHDIHSRLRQWLADINEWRSELQSA